MLDLPKNHTLKGLVYATTVAVALCYAWLMARMLEPTFSAPSSVAISVFARTGEEIEFFEDHAREFPTETLRLNEELQWAAAKLQLLGELSPAVRVVVEIDRPGRLAVTSDRIEIGTQVLKASGQLKKAVLKAWLLQKLSPELTGSFLRLEVASDFLLAVLDGGLKLQVPGETKPLRFESSARSEFPQWWSFADNYQGMCKSPWRSLEPQTLCDFAGKEPESLAISNLSFRPFLGQQLWNSYLEIPLAKRETFVRAWLKSLSSDEESESLAGETVSGVSSSLSELTVESGAGDWSLRLKGEMDQLLSPKLDPLKDERAKWNSSFDAPVIVIDEAGRVAAPGTLKVAATDFKIRKAKLTFLTECQPPTLQKLTTLPIESARVVWKPECAERRNDFIQVRPSSVALALKRGLAKPSDRLDHFVRGSLAPLGDEKSVSDKSDLLGLREAKWDAQKKSYQVKGAIEAVEEFRLNAGAI